MAGLRKIFADKFLTTEKNGLETVSTIKNMLNWKRVHHNICKGGRLKPVQLSYWFDSADDMDVPFVRQATSSRCSIWTR